MTAVLKKRRLAALFEDGETRTRTGDTTIFSRVLYQLSYLAATADGIGSWRACGDSPAREPAPGADVPD